LQPVRPLFQFWHAEPWLCCLVVICAFLPLCVDALYRRRPSHIGEAEDLYWFSDAAQRKTTANLYTMAAIGLGDEGGRK
jgi:hypothetical protein